ncbi:MAG: hypothetical protein J4F35_08165 [Candidatus Latescibacteria bacterium]|nr:hypothetical protein [Candidatus Latescibacterota bacterium]
MGTQWMRLVVPLVLCVLLASPADAQDEGVFEGSPMDFLPLEVGNQWTYTHGYLNDVYGYNYEIFFGWVYDLEAFDPLSLLRDQLTMEIPGYPLPPNSADLERPPKDLRFHRRELTIEITHTETIEGHEYFVFSEPYDWPPVPTLCLAGQKVRFSDAGVLLVRQQEQDILLYDFAPPYEYDSLRSDGLQSDKTYPTRPYRVLYDAHDPVRIPLLVHRFSWDARLRIHWDLFYPPPLSFGPAFVTRFSVQPGWGDVYFLANYGLALYEVWYPGFDWNRIFENSLMPVSAVIGGKEIAYPYGFQLTAVQPTSWGQLKERHRQGP